MLMSPTANPRPSARTGQPLPASLPQGFMLQARCVAADCGALSPIDPGPWLAQGLAGATLERLETRLRCTCGARRAALEIVAGAKPQAGRPAIFVFF